MIDQPVDRPELGHYDTEIEAIKRPVSRRLARLMGGELTYEYDRTASESFFRLTIPDVTF